jgi:hypothetical protein
MLHQPLHLLRQCRHRRGSISLRLCLRRRVPFSVLCAVCGVRWH